MADVQVERVDFALAQAMHAGRLATLGAVVFGFTAATEMDWRSAGGWTLTVMATLLGRNAVLTRVRRTIDLPGGAARAVRALWWASFVMGLAIASLPLLGFAHISTELRMLLTLFYCCWVAGAMSTLGILPVVFLGYSGLLFAGVFAGWVSVRDPFVPAVGVALFVYWVILQSFARNFAKRVEEGIAIRHENDELVREVSKANSAAEQLVQQLSETNAALRAANEAKAQFIMSASHDLRQPLHAIGLLSGILSHASHPADLESAKAALDAALAGLNSLFTAVLDLSRLDSGNLRTDLRVVPIHALVGRLDVEYRALCLEEGRRWECQCEQAYARTDAVFLERILRNLLDNALKHGGTGFVRLSAEVNADSSVTLSVSDNGPGIPAHEQEKVFQDFYRGGRAAGTRGMGLGLAYARRFAKALGSPLLVAFTDAQAHRGARFCMHLALASEGELAQEAAPGEPEQEDADVAGLRVLLLDDEYPVLDATRALLTYWGCEVRACLSVEQLDETAREAWRPDVAVVDYRLDGGVSGLQAIKPLCDRHPEMGVVVVTGESGAEALAALRESGFPLLTKPADAQELRRTLNLFKVVNS